MRQGAVRRAARCARALALCAVRGLGVAPSCFHARPHSLRLDPPARHTTAAPNAASAGGARQPWLVIWRRGVDGSRLYQRLCPSMGIPADPGDAPGAAPPKPHAGGASAKLWATDMLAWGSGDGTAAPLDCMARYDTLINGFSGAHGGRQARRMPARAHAWEVCGRRLHACAPPGALADMQPHARRHVAVTTSPTRRALCQLA